MHKTWLFFFLIFTSAFSLAQKTAWQPAVGTTTVPLWPRAAPGSDAKQGRSDETAIPGDHTIGGKPIIRLGNVSAPTLTLYSPTGPNSRSAILVFPGGGYNILAIDLEGTEVCDWLTSIGINCILVKYRVPGSGPYPQSSAGLQDAQRALGIVRAHAEQWHIDPNRVGVLGFSAGAHLSAALSTHFDKRIYDSIDAADQLSCRPDFVVMVYPAYIAHSEQNLAVSSDLPVTASTPSTFLLQAEDDPHHVENAVTYFLTLKNAKVQAELHIYAEGGHGYGLRRTALPVTGWPKLVEAWLAAIKVLPATREEFPRVPGSAE